ncbi:hypothetical protein [Geobacter sulfurreducens]|uniref:hypothetical protein n=1 Tax=Geobacter sulfurreducens TaxID=35554 RepID=UPI002B610BFC|nr:hypothetical protein [Geobacter sulfurreducens]HML77427.1 hypothetical protein [Geobacter sulfurreducens]
MVQIIDKKVNLEYPLGHHLHCMIAQVPNHLRGAEKGFAIEEPDRQWERVRSILDLVAAGEGNLKKLHFLMFPETHVPVDRFDEMLTVINETFRPNTVTMFGVEHVSLKAYREMLERFREDNAEAIELVDRDIDSGDVLEMPVNWCCIAVKEATGKLRVFLEAKSHPFHGEEFLDKFHDLYRGRHFYLFRSRPSCFNFMVLICLDYLYRDLYSSNIKQIIDHANQLYFSTRQTLDTIFVVQCNPKPEHRAYRDVLAGFYGEYLEDTPGVRETVTVFGNTSDETRIEDVPGGNAFGTSSVVINSSHRLARVQLSEFATDDFDGAPICRLRFGTGTRLYYFNLPLHHEIDPRTTRVPLKVHTIMRPSRDGGWLKISGDEMVAGFEIGQDA